MEKLEMNIAELDDLARQERRAYSRRWYKEHPGKNKEYQKRYWRKKALEKARQRQVFANAGV